MRHIKRKPKQFIILLVLSSIYIMVNVSNNDSIWWSIAYGVLVISTMMTLFITTSDEEEMNRLLDQEVKRLNMSRERLSQVTGYNRYEVSKSEDGQIIFWISMNKKKELLQKLRNMNPES
ncbi:hypothetical protein [Macrococcus armenti]|uniref:hypothetical protein n=1 Tax=Macrococcus armenti TaxID=2875764 RepID=UPI001CC9C6EE|nr:hypothetical protein [Macrococcus armenti]UBH15095.1 hypothetical protein LAU44_10195 [Macrococcus armenti]UBH17456.1 hypothetical protein LAU39_10225 [Macrococcus armenti]UBH19720.1 hypothetical protein LAU40_10200 [Macrococcus armenti]